jgi:diguanylate cyclase (GGDEF)-like protein/PAS domain S-box-containing protein
MVTSDGLVSSPAPLLLFRDEMVVGVSDSACRQLARDRSELMGGGFVESLLADDRESFLGLLRQVDGSIVSAPVDDALQVRRRARNPSDVAGIMTDVLELQVAACSEGVLVDARDVTESLRRDRLLTVLASNTFVMDASGTIIWRTLSQEATLEAQGRDSANVNPLLLVHPDDLPDAMSDFVKVLEEPDDVHVTFYRAHREWDDKEWGVCRITGVNQLDDPLIGGVVIRSEPDTILQVDAIDRTAGDFHSLAASAPIGIIVSNLEGLSIYRNRLADELLGLDGTEVGNMCWTAAMPPSDRAVIQAIFRDRLEHRSSGSAVVTIERPGVGTAWVRVDVLPQLSESGKAFGMIATFLDVTSEIVAKEGLQKAQNQLWRLANHDILTGLPNRMQFNDRLDAAFVRRSRDQQNVAVLFCDVDNFKPVNDDHGHHVGDALLVEIAHRLDGTTRATETVYRIGGDEFVVICEGFADPADLGVLAARLIARVGDPVHLGDVIAQVGLSVGIAVAGAESSGDSLLADADAALYRAKELGRNCFTVAGVAPVAVVPAGGGA